jgi:enoyl-CoA hydratase/carnithine racemase
LPFTVPMNALIKARLPTATAHEAMVTGRRYTAEQALAAQIVQHSAPEAELLPAALALAKAHAGKDGPTLATIKQTAYREVLAAIDAERAQGAAAP